MSDDRFARIVHEAQQAPFRLAVLAFFLMVGITTVLGTLGLRLGDVTERMAVSAIGAGLFVSFLRARRR